MAKNTFKMLQQLYQIKKKQEEIRKEYQKLNPLKINTFEKE